MGSSLTIPTYSMSKKIFHIIFFIAALLAFASLLFHVKEYFYPGAQSPPWRHAVFFAVNCICIFGLLKRPEWFTWFIAILTIQQWYSHGSYVIELWQKQHTIHWISVGVIIFLPVIFILLLLNGRSKNEDRANQQHS